MSPLTSQRRKQLGLLGGLLLLWGWVLWGQLGGDAAIEVAQATTVTVDEVPLIADPAAEPSTTRTRTSVPEARRIVASEEIRALQRARYATKFERSPFTVPGLRPTDSAETANSGEFESPGATDGLRLTSIVIGPHGNSAVIGGRFVREGETIDASRVLVRVHDDWVEIESRDGGKQRIEMKKRVLETRN